MTRNSHESRERLFGPFALGGLGLVFAAAFATLAYAPRSTLTAGNAGDSNNGASLPDELQVAYLRAAIASDKVDDAALFSSVLALAREGRSDEAQLLLRERPAIASDPANWYRLQLELQFAGWRTAASGAERTERRGELHATLTALRADQKLHTVPTLERAAMVSGSLQDVPLIAGYHRLLADVDEARGVRWLRSCGDTLVAVGAVHEAIRCYQDAAALSHDPAERYKLELQRLAITDNTSLARELATSLATAEDAPVNGLESLAGLALAKQLPDLASVIYGDLANRLPARRNELLQKAARWAEAAGTPDLAAAWLAFVEAGTDTDLARSNTAERRRLLLAAGENTELLALAARQVDIHPDDREVVADAVSIATAAGEISSAVAWNNRYLEAHPDDLEAVATAIDLSMASGNLSAARRWATVELAQRPDDAEVLERSAQLAEWSGDAEGALHLRERLAEERGTVREWREVERLAELVFTPDAAANALENMARIREPDEALVKQLIKQHELEGRPQAAIDAIDAINERYGVTRWRLRERALLYQRHRDQERALLAWEALALQSGRDQEETLARIELLWQMSRPDETLPLVKDLLDKARPGPASKPPTPYQASLVVEIAWRYRLEDVAALVDQWGVDDIDPERRAIHASRRVDALVDAGRLLDASHEAETYWTSSGDQHFLVTALRTAADASDASAARRLLDLLDQTGELDPQTDIEVLTIRAGLALQSGDVAGARQYYDQARELEPDNATALSGLMWLAIGQSDSDLLQQLLNDDLEAMSQDPGLWPALAIAYVAVGDPSASLPWFEKALSGAQSDYSLVLSWADALEQAQDVDRARDVRRWAVTELRPRLLAGLRGHEGELIRQYGEVLGRFSSVEDNEAWMRLMMSTDLDVSDRERVWREDMAIAWLMATERQDYARIVMARQHDRRMITPAWQDLALALSAHDHRAVLAILESGNGLSAAGRMLALREVGRDAEAFALALKTIERPPSLDDLAVARTQYVALRRYRPSHLTATHTDLSTGNLNAGESAFSLRYAPGISGLGYAVDVKRIDYRSSELVASALQTRQRAQLGLFSNDSRQAMTLFAGVDSDSEDTRLFAHGSWTLRDAQGQREVGLALAWQEPADESPELYLAGKRDRVGLSAEKVFANDTYVRLNAGAKRLSGRVSDALLATGVHTRAEYGIQRGAGSLSWGSSVSLASEVNDRADRLPQEFVLSPNTSFDSVIVDERTSLSLNGTLARGGIGNDYPDIASPRFHLTGSIGYAWPDNRLGMNVDAGAGIRVIGQDELAVRFKQSTTLQGESLSDDGRTFGVDYRFQF